MTTKRLISRTILAALAVITMAALAACQQKPAADCDRPQPDEKRCKIERKAKPAATKPAGAAAKAAPQTPPGQAKKSRDPIPDVPLGNLKPRQRELFYTIVEGQFDPCGGPTSFADVLRQGRKACPVALDLARFLLKRIKAGDDREAAVLALIGELQRVHHEVSFDLKGRPSRGGQAPGNSGDGKPGPIIVEFYDYECPYCRKVQPELDALLERFPNVRLVMKQCPIEGHLVARDAALAALAAQRQGKFWEMHAALFARGDDLDEAGIRAAAVAAGLNIERFDADMSGKSELELEALIDADLAEADKAEVPGTPSFWLDGVETPFDRLAEELEKR